VALHTFEFLQYNIVCHCFIISGCKDSKIG
jgi:hypothetical protein